MIPIAWPRKIREPDTIAYSAVWNDFQLAERLAGRRCLFLLDRLEIATGSEQPQKC
jgi:hypothetical protein